MKKAAVRMSFDVAHESMSDAVSAWHEPDKTEFINPFNSPDIIGYYDAVNKWHGYIKFLGMPHLRDNPDVRIKHLYVEPTSCAEYVSPDTSPDSRSDCLSVVETLKAFPRLVLLGDPGSGKSTLVNWISWLFSSPDESLYTTELDRLVPFPFILRELSVTSGITWESLLELFLQTPMAKALAKNRELIERILASGQALLMFDGVDEIGSLKARRALKNAVLEVAERYPSCRILVTSRIIGYDDVPFDRMDVEKARADEDFDELKPNGALTARKITDLRYVAPFSDAQIKEFARKWYMLREANEDLRQGRADDFVNALHGSDATLRLGRIPNILTFMALIHRIKAQLPHGKAMLYSQIAEAYLYSIDEFRGLYDTEFTRLQKMRWLGFVGYNMQCRRSGQDKDNNALLVTEEQLVAWVLEAMRATGEKSESEDEAKNFIDYIGRRSGLLIPRSEGMYAFVHLSFQEFFAAYHLSKLIVSPNSKSIYGDLKKYRDDPLWRESLVFLFEIIADNSPEWTEELRRRIFPENRRRDWNGQVLLAALSVDPHTGIRHDMRKEIWQELWAFNVNLNAKRRRLFGNAIVQALMSPGRYLEEVWKSLEQLNDTSEVKITSIDLSGCTGITDISPLAKLTDLRYISLTDCSAIVDIQPLAGLSDIDSLDLVGCTAIADISPIGRLQQLWGIQLSNIDDSKLSVISELGNLGLLNIEDSPDITDISVLGELGKLGALLLSGNSSITDISPLAKLGGLKVLYIFGCTGFSNISVLSRLVKLRTLHIVNCSSVTDLPSMIELKDLRVLRMAGCKGITDISQLGNLRNLRKLYITNCTGITDVSPLANLRKLKTLNLSDCTGLASVSPLSGLKNLQYLAVSNCPGITDLDALKTNEKLEILGV